MASDRDGAHPFGGFHSYADDTPRDAPEEVAGPLAAGWSDTPAWRAVEPPPPSWRLPVAASAAVVALIGAGVGWAVLRDPAAPPAPEAAGPPSETLEVVVTDPPPPPTPVGGERLEVLPQPGAASARTPLAEVVIPVTPEVPATPAPPRAMAEAPPPPAPREAPSVAQAAQDASVRRRPEPPRFNACRDAPTRAYEMVCSDRRLAEADRRMKRAYSAALAAGVPPDELRRDQEDWLDVREDAAHVSRRAVADIYRQRTRELFAMADGRRD